MTEKIIIAGAGGQGVMLLGKVLAEGAMRKGKFVTCLPSYGAEVRGGTAHCMIVISDKEVGAPYVDKADTLIIMNSPSLDKFKGRIKKQGDLILNSSLAKSGPAENLKIHSHPFTGIAIRLGNIKVANMVALGFYLAQKKIIGINDMFKVIEDIAPVDKRSLIGINQQALREGMKLGGGQC